MNVSSRFHPLLRIPFLALIAFFGVSAAAQPLPEGFYGEFVGEGASDVADEIEPRDLRVIIRRAGRGFEVEWVTVVHKTGGQTRRSTYAVRFVRSVRAGTFASAMRRDMFGREVPLDPMKGDPFVWATLAGSTLTVHALLIPADGGYEIQTYERTLLEGGKLMLEFHRVKNGRVLRTVRGSLKRVGD